MQGGTGAAFSASVPSKAGLPEVMLVMGRAAKRLPRITELAPGRITIKITFSVAPESQLFCFVRFLSLFKSQSH